MTRTDITPEYKPDLIDIYDQVDALRKLGNACRALTSLLDNNNIVYPLIDLLFDQVDEKTAQLSYSVELFRGENEPS